MENVRRFINWLCDMKDVFLMIFLVFGFLTLVAVKLGDYENWKTSIEPEIEYKSLLRAALRHHHCRHCKVYHPQLQGY